MRPEHDSRSSVMADADSIIASVSDVQRGRTELQSDRDASITPWSAVEWIECRDGKVRPIEPGLKPLDYGIPARLGRLRGYGNAINPELAASFIEAYCEVRGLK